MPTTFTFAVNNAGYTNIVVQSHCKKITIFENDLAGTADYLAAVPAGSATPVTQPAGTSFIFEAPDGSLFTPGDIVGAIKAVSGSMTFAQLEQ